MFPSGDDTKRKIIDYDRWVTGDIGDYDGRVSYDSLFLGGQIAAEANRIKRAVLDDKDPDQFREISFKRWQEIVRRRAEEGLQLQLDKQQRDEIVQQLSQKQKMLNRNAIFEDMYFKKAVFERKGKSKMPLHPAYVEKL